MSENITSAQALTVGEVSKRSGVPVSTLHFYESKGLLNPRRSSGNQRLYSRGMLRRIAIIRVAQSVGISLAEIKKALEPVPDQRKPTAEEWATVSRDWVDTLSSRIDQLIALKNNLERCIGCGCLSLTECPLRNPNDELAVLGDGARLLQNSAK